MAKNSWELKINGHDELLVRMERYSSESERLINEALKSKGSDIAVDRITEKIPVSEADLRSGHQHAKIVVHLRLNILIWVSSLDLQENLSI